MLANGVKETTATTGTGTVTLSAASGFVRFADAFLVGDRVSYAISDGSNWEWGIGEVAAGNTLVRQITTAKLESGVYSKYPATKLSLSGSATVVATATDHVSDPQHVSSAIACVYSSHMLRTSSYFSTQSWDGARVFPFIPPPNFSGVASGMRMEVYALGTATKARIGVCSVDDLSANRFGKGKTLLTQTVDMNLTTTGIKEASFVGGAQVNINRPYTLFLLMDGNATLRCTDGAVVLPGLAQESATGYPRGNYSSDATTSGWTQIEQSYLDAYHGIGDWLKHPLIGFLMT